MENHPIPQNITGFEFKLVGNMTLKQFAYLASGVIIAWVLYSLPLFFLINIPLALLFVGLGAAMAFLPIEGRPMDVMIKNFFIAVFAPTQYTYQKAEEELSAQNQQEIKDFNKKKLSISDMSEKQLNDFLKNLPKNTSKLDKKEMVFFQSLNSYGAGASSLPQPKYVPEHAFAKEAPVVLTQPEPKPAQQPMPNNEDKSPKIEAPNQNLQKTTEFLQKELDKAKGKEAQGASMGTKEYLEAHQKVLELQQNFSDVLSQKQQLETKLAELQKQMATQQKPVFTPSALSPAQELPKQTQNVRSIPQNMAKSIGIPSTPEFPNLLTGIVVDPRGNPLANILIEVKDEQGNDVRAFKTNALGQFMSATALANGNYTINFEDPKGGNKFDSVGFLAKGEIILPIQAISVDTREEIRKSLFN